MVGSKCNLTLIISGSMVDDNRVILKRCTDYRSSARGTSESVSRFIATQGQLSHTSEDFWEMIIQYHCPVIVMLTRLVDNYRANRMRASDMINRCTVALDSLNYSKNRYTDVLPFDDNRVILKRCTYYRSSARGTSESVSRFIATQVDDNRVILKRCTDYRSSARGYINASFVTTSESVSRFIATQGQLSHTSEDFWEMIIQYHCPVIVMLTRLVDNYRANRMRASDMINRCTVALDSLNYSKNRYTDVLPFDDNRVILKRCTDYRSSARGTSESVSRFIATQGPLSHTSEDFWEMIIQYHCPVIVMLTRLVDNYREQCLFCYDATIDELDPYFADYM
ncbi:UNVERIFIED_CONTAM: Protein-tyrosine-phosphatase PTP1 [Sesamum calycinum]|uniref:Protein-tyrosine-phosphatase PTP1 n=1 Tax=Sesamum calycinum TaxID=2727403 RepID=A0AAW2JIC5_9LAMI